MTRKERLERTFRGESVDRPAVSFYEIDGNQDTTDPNPFNIFNSPDWEAVIDLARERTDRMVRVHVPVIGAPADPMNELMTTEVWIDDTGTRRTKTTIKAGNRTLAHRTRQDPGVNTVWTEEHLLKDLDDLKAYLKLPVPVFGGTPDPTDALKLEKRLGDSGVLRIDTGDPLCVAADLFDMATFTIIAMTERDLFLSLLERIQSYQLPRIQSIAEAIPGRHWRVCGAEYASPPYLPPRLFRDYVTAFDAPIVKAVHGHGGFVRIHCHGRIKDILDDIVATGCMGLDPIEPPQQGDVELADVRARYGDQLVLFGNLEATDLENLPPAQFETKVRSALEEGVGGKGFVLMPSACPYGRDLSPHVLPNYLAMIKLAEEYAV